MYLNWIIVRISLKCPYLMKWNTICTITEVSEATEPAPEQLDDMWDEVSGQLSSIFQGRDDILTDIAPFDAASEIEEQQQRSGSHQLMSAWTNASSICVSLSGNKTVC